MGGTQKYIEDVLKKLTAKKSNVQLGWAGTTVVTGKCSDAGYYKSSPRADYDYCFPEAKLFFDDNENHTKFVPKMDDEFIQLYRVAHPEMKEKRFNPVHV